LRKSGKIEKNIDGNLRLGYWIWLWWEWRLDGSSCCHLGGLLTFVWFLNLTHPLRNFLNLGDRFCYPTSYQTIFRAMQRNNTFKQLSMPAIVVNW